jgi:hypothetical protein
VTTPTSLPSFYCKWDIPLLLESNTHFSQDWSSSSSPSFSSTTFQNFPGIISDLLSEVSTFQHYTMLWSKCSTFLKFMSNLLVKRVFSLLNAACTVAVLGFILHVNLAFLVATQCMYFNYYHYAPTEKSAHSSSHFFHHMLAALL